MESVIPNGSPLDARQNPLYLMVFLCAVGIIILCVAVYLVFKMLNRIRQSPAWIEAHKNKPTTFLHVHKLAKQMALTQEEEMLLWEACRRVKAPNVLYLVKDMAALDNLLRNEYIYMKGQNKSESLVYTLFVLRSKIAAVYVAASRIKTTSSFPVGQILYINRTSSMKLPMEVIQNDKSGLYLLLPPNMQSQGARPVELSKVQFSIPATAGGIYIFSTRVVRYTTMKDGRLAMIVSHTNEVSFQERRKQKRIGVDQMCDFSAVKILTKKDGTVTYTPQENRYEARLKDISAGGCKLMAKTPIKEGQHLHIKFILAGTVCEAVGVIIRTTKGTDTDSYFLAIKFAKISDKVRNDILALVYNYIN